MNLFKQLLLGGIFIASMYCSVFFLWMGDYVASALLALIALSIFIEGQKLIKQLIHRDCEIRKEKTIEND